MKPLLCAGLVRRSPGSQASRLSGRAADKEVVTALGSGGSAVACEQRSSGVREPPSSPPPLHGHRRPHRLRSRAQVPLVSVRPSSSAKLHSARREIMLLAI
jgi:hypothetical protein